MANNTGVFFNINDNDGIPLVGVSTDGRVLINHLYGNCLIGSTSSTGTASQPLQVTGGAYVSGNLGVGITNPVSNLDIGGPIISRDGSFVIQSLFGGGATASWTNPQTATNVDHIWHLDGVVGTGVTWGLGGIWNFVSDSTYKADGNSWIRAGGFANTTPTLGASYPLQISGNAYVSGNLGIGVLNPAAKLDIKPGYGTTYTGTFTGVDSYTPTTGEIRIGSDNDGAASAGDYVGLRFSIVGNGSGNANAGIFAVREQAEGNGKTSLAFATRNWGGNSNLTEKVRITSDGYLGIGITNPQAKLDVNGDVNISGILTASKVASGIPQNSKTSAYVLQKSDVGKYISITSGGVTVPSGIFSEGDVISVYNNSAGDQTITQGTSVTMYFSGTSITGNRTISQRGLVTILCVGSNTFIIGGAGLS